MCTLVFFFFSWIFSKCTEMTVKLLNKFNSDEWYSCAFPCSVVIIIVVYLWICKGKFSKKTWILAGFQIVCIDFLAANISLFRTYCSFSEIFFLSKVFELKLKSNVFLFLHVGILRLLVFVRVKFIFK